MLHMWKVLPKHEIAHHYIPYSPFFRRGLILKSGILAASKYRGRRLLIPKIQNSRFWNGPIRSQKQLKSLASCHQQLLACEEHAHTQEAQIFAQIPLHCAVCRVELTDSSPNSPPPLAIQESCLHCSKNKKCILTHKVGRLEKQVFGQPKNLAFVVLLILK